MDTFNMSDTDLASYPRDTFFDLSSWLTKHVNLVFFKW